MDTSIRSRAGLLDPDFYVDFDAMHEELAWMRAEDPVHRDEASGVWAITRHADVVDVERRDQVFVSSRGYRSFLAPGEDNMIALDDPAHVHQRRLVSGRVTPRQARGLRPLVSAMVDELVEGFVDNGELEVVTELAAPLPCRLTAHLLGFPQERWTDLRSWSERLMRYDATSYDPDVERDFFAAVDEYNALLTSVVAERRAEPGEDMISDWVHARLDGCPMTDATMMNEAGLLICGGAETTRTVIARSLRTWCDHPDQWEAVAADPSLVPGAVEEMVRWVTPLNNFFRTAAEPATVGGTELEEGARVVLLYPSANRDQAVFDDPFRFDVSRRPNPHVGFGFGTHFCLGSWVARLELGTLLAALTSRITNLSVVEEPDIEANIFVGAVRSFRLAFDRR